LRWKERRVAVDGRERIYQGAVDLKLVVAFVLLVAGCFALEKGAISGLEAGKIAERIKTLLLCSLGKPLPELQQPH
jgi:hypothetical protein